MKNKNLTTIQAQSLTLILILNQIIGMSTNMRLSYKQNFYQITYWMNCKTKVYSEEFIYFVCVYYNFENRNLNFKTFSKIVNVHVI